MHFEKPEIGNNEIIIKNCKLENKELQNLIKQNMFSFLLHIENHQSYFNKDYEYMICGHYHLGEIFEIKEGKLAVLGDWFHRPSYAIFDGEKLDLVNWTSNEK